MDISSPCGKSVLKNVDSFPGLQPSANQAQSPNSSLSDRLVSDLVNAVDESLNIKDVEEESLNIKDFVEESLNLKDVGKEYVGIKDVGEVEHASSNEEIISGVEKRKPCDGPKAQQGKITQNCLNKCVTFPNANGVLPRNASSDMAEEEPETAMQTPAPSKLLSAMKGSREKEGLSPGKLTVTWAPDVYDPPTTSMSHTVTGKKQQKSKNKKNWKRDGKKGQKGSSSRGKEKKQYRKGGASERSHRYLDSRETLVGTNNDFGDLVVGSPDQHSYCGSSFLKNSLTSMHYPVAEAL
ncbi:hypothetical protein PRUPE_6G250300 [Prunus persica]|uniref:Uncharacterized protein n=1 Tax=Prunus persica TaxID=3760 RepID=M5W5D3_PRUPE|nr:uncharacterized protein LOC18773003 [Prunus persica]ONI03311.1 hypothetical protein PRUPE_6G250300 [Prunus persica]